MPKHFIIRTDHSAIQWLQGSKNTSKIFERWMTILDDLDYEEQPTKNPVAIMEEMNYHIIHRPGTAHANADALSRLYANEQPTEQNQKLLRPLKQQDHQENLREDVTAVNDENQN